MYKIERGIKIPDNARISVQDEAYKVITQMKVGNSFLFEGKNYTQVMAAVRQVRRDNKSWDFVSRKLTEAKRRLWRIK